MNQITPQHISFVLDGNRRWAKAQGLPTLEGHLRGTDAVFNIIQWCSEVGVKYLTTYAFSTENWDRPQEELNYLFGIVFEQGIKKYLPQLLKDNVKVNLFGRLDRFPAKMQAVINDLLAKTAGGTGLIWNVCMDYGGRAEIIQAVKKIVEAGVVPEEITDQAITNQMYSAGVPDPDLMIRTGGEHRLSNFLLWQHAYTELYFAEIYLPAFSKKDFDEALEWYANRERRYGK